MPSVLAQTMGCGFLQGKRAPKRGGGWGGEGAGAAAPLGAPQTSGTSAAAAGAAGCRNPAIFRHVFQPRLLLLLSRRVSRAVASNQNKTLPSWLKCSDKTVVDSLTTRGTPKTHCGAWGCPSPLPPWVLLMLY